MEQLTDEQVERMSDERFFAHVRRDAEWDAKQWAANPSPPEVAYRLNIVGGRQQFDEADEAWIRRVEGAVFDFSVEESPVVGCLECQRLKTLADLVRFAKGRP